MDYDVQAFDESNSLHFVTHTRIMMGQREEAWLYEDPTSILIIYEYVCVRPCVVLKFYGSIRDEGFWLLWVQWIFPGSGRKPM